MQLLGRTGQDFLIKSMDIFTRKQTKLITVQIDYNPIVPRLEDTENTGIGIGNEGCGVFTCRLRFHRFDRRLVQIRVFALRPPAHLHEITQFRT